MAYSKELLIEVSLLHYKNKLRQESIAKKLNISKSQVTRILKRANEVGIVQINIVDPNKNYEELEIKLAGKFNLKKAIVIENLGLSDKELDDNLGHAASNYLQDIIKDGDIIGVSWGTNINEVINNLPDIFDRNLEVIQLTGGIKGTNYQDSARQLASKFGIQPHSLFAPAMISSKITRDLLVREKSIREIFEFFKKLNIALVSIGSTHHKTTSTLVKSLHVSEDELKYLVNKGAVGDVCMHFFDINGVIIDNNIGGKVIAIPAKDLIEVPYSIGIAGGTRMAEAIYGALKGKFINVLITDYVTAQKVFDLENNISITGNSEKESGELHYKGGQLVIS